MKNLTFVLLTTASLAIMPLDAYAYLDPGTGSLLLQGFIVAVTTVGAVLKLYWHRIVHFFSPKKNSKSAEKTESSNNEKLD